MYPTPAYRGTQSDLRSNAEQASTWFFSQIMIAVESLTAEQKARVIQEMSSDTALTIQRVTQSSTSYKKDDFFYEWETGENLRSQWSRQKFVLRKNNTIHMENLIECLRRWADKKLYESEAERVSRENKALFEKAGSPKHEWVTTRLSEHECGKAFVSLTKRFSTGKVELHKSNVDIKDLQATIDNMVTLAEMWVEG